MIIELILGIVQTAVLYGISPHFMSSLTLLTHQTGFSFVSLFFCLPFFTSLTYQLLQMCLVCLLGGKIGSLAPSGALVFTIAPPRPVGRGKGLPRAAYARRVLGHWFSRALVPPRTLVPGTLVPLGHWLPRTLVPPKILTTKTLVP